MKIGLTISTIVLGIAAILLGLYAFTVAGDRNSLQEELDETQDTLVVTQQELKDTEEILDETAEDLEDTRDNLEEVEGELEDTLDTLDETQDELNDTADELRSTQLQLATVQDDLEVAQQQRDDAEEELVKATAEYLDAIETLAGLDITLSKSAACNDVVLIDNPEATHPSWAELKAFLAQDHTEDHEYILHVYDCSEFSRDLHNLAEAAGIRCAEVQVILKDEPLGHALNAFLTTDYGLVYVDCSGGLDGIARVKSQYYFRAVSVSTVSIAHVRDDSWWASLMSYYYLPSVSGGQCVVSSIKIYW